MKSIARIIGGILIATITRLSALPSFGQPVPPPIGGTNSPCTNCPGPIINTNRNYVKYMNHVFSVIDTNAAAITDTNLYEALLTFPADTNSTPNLQIMLHGTNNLLIKANNFDYSAETERDFALLISDKAESPVWKSIDFFGASDAQDGWLVQGTVPNWQVSNPMYFRISDFARDCNAFFRTIAYRGPEITFLSPQQYDTVSNTITLEVVIEDLSGITNSQFEVTVDGLPARYHFETNGTVSLNTKYHPEGPVNVHLRGLSRALACNLTNTPDNAKIVFEQFASLPLTFENDTYLLFGSDYASSEIGTNYFYFVTDKPQTITASIFDPADGRVVATYGGYVPYGATISLAWNFTDTGGTSPYTNDTYAVSFETSNPTQIIFTNQIARDGVRVGAGCFLTYQEEDPFDPAYGSTSVFLNQEAETYVNQNLKTLYRDLYKTTSLTQYSTSQAGTNRNHSDCVSLNLSQPEWAEFMRPAMTNLNFSDLTVAQAHGNGIVIGGGPYLLNRFSAEDLNDWLLNGRHSDNWRLRKTAIWTCFSAAFPEETMSFTFPQAAGIRPASVQRNAYVRKNCGLFFDGKLPQGWVTENQNVSTAQAG